MEEELQEEQVEYVERRIDPRAIRLLYFLQGMDINQKSDKGKTVLQVAVLMKDKEVASTVLEVGADVNVKDNDGNTALSSAIDIRSPELVELLLKYNPNLDMEIVREKFYARLFNSCSDDKKIVEIMMQHGFTVKETDNTNRSMLWSAIQLGIEELAISLVNCKKSFFKQIDMWYHSFLLHTQPFTETQTNMLKIITKIRNMFMANEKWESTGNHNLDLFRIMLSEHHIELINVNLVSIGGNLDDIYGSDIVAIARDILLSCYDGENPVCDDKGRTGLHYAAKVGNVAVIQALLDMHLDINATDIEGKTPLDYIYQRNIEYSRSENNSEIYDTEFNCYFTLLDLKIGALIFLKHTSKLITANSYLTIENLETVKSLLTMMNNNMDIAQYFITVYKFIEQCESEINEMKNKKLLELTYYDFLTKNSNQIALYTKRSEVIEAFRNDSILKEFEIYGPLLQRRFQISSIRRGLLENAETILFDIMKWLQLPLVVVREILSNLSNNELMVLVLST